MPSTSQWFQVACHRHGPKARISAPREHQRKATAFAARHLVGDYPLAGLAFFAGFKVFNLRRILGDTEDVMLILFAVGFVFAIVAFAESILRKYRLLLPLLGLSFYLVVLLLVFAVFVKATFEIDAAGGSR